MKLKELLRRCGVCETCGKADVDIAGLRFDSREVLAGELFFALPGSANDGHDYIDKAVSRGAVAIVCERLPEGVEGGKYGGVAFIRVEDAHAALGEAASEWYGRPSEKLRLVGVTGTNGKTTTATLLYDMFRGLGYRAGLISTVKYCVDDRVTESTHTTPDAIKLNKLMNNMVEAGCDYCFMEVSSHAIAQRRVEGLRFEGGIFTNLTHDHLDYHKTFAEYIRVKKMFFDSLGKDAFALVNADDKNGMVMVQNCRAKVYTYSMRGLADFRCRVLETIPEGMLTEINRHQVWLRFLGKFNAYNLTAVYGAARLLGADEGETFEALSKLKSVSGRFETIHSKDGVTAVVDYAHTPDALENVLTTVNEICKGRVIVVVGCGGDRDRTKRPEMAKTAVMLSGLAIFTSDNPRTEDPAAILEDMASGVRNENAGRYLIISDRREAIKTAVMMAGEGDFVLVAGKGHETYQIIGTLKTHFDDREEVELCFEARASNKA